MRSLFDIVRWKCRAVKVYTMCDSSVYCGLFISKGCASSIKFTFASTVSSSFATSSQAFDQRPLFKFTLELYSLLLRFTVQNVILRNLFKPNKVMGWNEIKVPGWAWRLAEHDSWKVLFPCVGGQISWTGASSSLCWCLTQERAYFWTHSCQVTGAKRPPTAVWLFFMPSLGTRGELLTCSMFGHFLIYRLSASGSYGKYHTSEIRAKWKQR